MNYNQIREQIRTALRAKFIKCDEIADVIATAIAAEKNVILWGPGGHAKSEMILEALSVIFPREEIFIQSLGEDTDEASFWGGVDFKKFKKEDKLEYHPENSFLKYKAAILEEIFDAPSVVLTSLKDTLTAKQLRKGNQVYDMQTKIIIGLSNKNPTELVSEGGSSVQALMERFPLHLKVEWPSYTENDYMELLHKVVPKLTSSATAEIAKLYCFINKKMGEKISPRTAVHGAHVVLSTGDYSKLSCLPGLTPIKKELDTLIHEMKTERYAQEQLQTYQTQFDNLTNEYSHSSSAAEFLKLYNKFRALGDEANEVTVTDGLFNYKNELIQNFYNYADHSIKQAAAYTT